MSERLAELDAELASLRAGYLVVNKRCTDALSSLRSLTMHAKDGAVSRFRTSRLPRIGQTRGRCSINC